MESKKEKTDLPLSFKVKEGETIVGKMALTLLNEMKKNFATHARATVDVGLGTLTLDIQINLKHGNEDEEYEEEE